MPACDDASQFRPQEVSSSQVPVYAIFFMPPVPTSQPPPAWPPLINVSLIHAHDIYSRELRQLCRRLRFRDFDF